MKKINQKGFTLIELLAAVVILGVLMLVAIPRVSKYIDDAKKNAFVSTAKAYIQDARLKVMNGEVVCKSGQYILFEDLTVDKGIKSPFNKNINRQKSYVQVNIGANSEYTFSVYMVEADSDPHGIFYYNGEGGTSAISEDSLKTDDVKKFGSGGGTTPPIPYSNVTDDNSNECQ